MVMVIVELYNRAENKEAAKAQVVKNKGLVEAVRQVETRGPSRL
jgi:hypothetical protein